MSDDSVDRLISFLIGVVVGMLVGAVLVNNAGLLNECESTLPRNEECILIAVPETQSTE